jgi:hypothetical protein
MSRKNGGIIGPANTPVGGLLTGVAGGVWRMNDVANFVGNSQWPTGPQSIDNSLRFNDGSSDSLTKTSSTGSNTTSTLSVWIKRANLGAEMKMLNFTGGSNNLNIEFKNDDQLSANAYDGSSQFSLKTNRKFRDTSSWYNIIVAIDSTQSTSSNRVKIYVNGVQETSFETSNYPSQDDTLVMNNHLSSNPFIGQNGGGSHYFDGYMAEICWIDGLQLDPTSFGETNTATGIWTPKKLGKLGTVGANTFYLDFKDSSNVGNDASGKNNDFTVSNLTSIDQSTDTCVVNYATLNPLDNYFASSTFSEGNLKIVTSSGNYTFNTGTIGVAAGKWYWEVKIVNSSTEDLIGITKNVSTGTTNYLGQNTGAVGYNDNGNTYVAGTNSSYGNSYTTNDIIGVALDVDNNKLYFSKNGTFQNSGVPTSGSTGTGAISIDAISGDNYFPAIGEFEGSSSGTFSLNFGSPPYTISSGNSDANGFGNFEYPVPSGYYALNTSNLNTYG